MNKLEGEKYGDCESWTNFIDIDITKNINYLEIGVYYGLNFISVLNTFCKNDKSKLHAIDCWSDEHYNHYEHLVNKGDQIYNTFLRNVSVSGGSDKLTVHRGYSFDKIKELSDNYFDIIYIDGCHEPESVMEDAVLSFRKLKNDGYIVFDDYNWSNETTESINSFIAAYSKRCKILGLQNGQMFIQKIINTDTPSVSFNT